MYKSKIITAEKIEKEEQDKVFRSIFPKITLNWMLMTISKSILNGFLYCVVEGVVFCCIVIRAIKMLEFGDC